MPAKPIMTAVLLAALAVLALPAYADDSHADHHADDVIKVYKSPSCGCCKLWVEHLEDEGFTVEAFDSDDMNAIKQELSVPRQLASCHTASVGGYTIEGHVPAADIRRLLTEKPAATGLAVPGMPLGSPGMEYGARVEAYDVLLFDGEQRRVYASYPQAEDNAAPAAGDD